MVHALQLIHKMLHPNGWLINVHGLPVPHMIEVRSPETVSKVGWILDREDSESTQSALKSLAQVVADRSFLLEDERDFAYNIYADDLPELRDWLKEWWSSAVLTDGIIQRLGELTRDPGPSARIALLLRARMTRLRAAGLHGGEEQPP